MTHLQHSGRGGAGNLSERVEDGPEPRDFPPELHGPYSTGRGGAANVQPNDSGPHVARIAQDLEGQDRKREDHRLLETSQYSGRGGVGNIEARRSQELSRSRGATPKSGDGTPAKEQQESRRHHEGFADKLKHALHHHSHEAREGM